jgi:hypothetical protein
MEAGGVGGYLYSAESYGLICGSFSFGEIMTVTPEPIPKKRRRRKSTPKPTLTLRGKFAQFSQTFLGKIVNSFVRAFAASFVIGLIGVLQNLSASHGGFSVYRDALLALVVASATAALRAVQHFFIDTPPAPKTKKR